MKKYDVAVVGATGAVGQAMIKILEQRQFPVGNVHLLASSRSAGSTLKFAGKDIVIEDLAEFDFSKVQIGLFSAGGDISAEFAPKAAAAGCIVIDNTSHFRMDKDIPLVVPEVNPEAIADYKNRGIIANPNCSTIQMVMALKPLHDAAIINRVVVSTYQSVSGAGKAAMDELFEQTKSIYANKNVEKKEFTKNLDHFKNLVDDINTYFTDSSLENLEISNYYTENFIFYSYTAGKKKGVETSKIDYINNLEQMKKMNMSINIGHSIYGDKKYRSSTSSKGINKDLMLHS